MRRSLRSILSVVALVLTAAAPAARADTPRFEITPFAGYRTGGEFEARNKAQRRRLAAAGGAEQRCQRSGFDTKRDIADGADGAVFLLDLDKFDRCRFGHQCAPILTTGAATERRPILRSPTSRWMPRTTTSMNTMSSEE